MGLTNQIFSQTFPQEVAVSINQYEFVLRLEASLNWVPLWVCSLSLKKRKKSQLFHFFPMAIFYSGFPFLLKLIWVIYVLSRKLFILCRFKHLLAMCFKSILLNKFYHYLFLGHLFMSMYNIQRFA